MKISKYLYLVVLSAFLLVFTGCGEEKTIYEDEASGDITTTTTAGTATTTTAGGTTTTTVAAALSGEAQFNKSCKSCHSAALLSKTTLAEIKAASMQMSLDDTQLQKIVDYLATL